MMKRAWGLSGVFRHQYVLYGILWVATTANASSEANVFSRPLKIMQLAGLSLLDEERRP